MAYSRFVQNVVPHPVSLRTARRRRKRTLNQMLETQNRYLDFQPESPDLDASDIEAGHVSSSDSLSNPLDCSSTPSAVSPSVEADNPSFGFFPYDAASRSDEEQDGDLEIESESVRSINLETDKNCLDEEEEFEDSPLSQVEEDQLLEYHRLLDLYNEDLQVEKDDDYGMHHFLLVNKLLKSPIRISKVHATLSEEDLDNVKMFFLRIKGHLSHELHELFCMLFSHRMILDTIYQLHQRILKLSRVSEVSLDACINSCCCFTGALSSLDICPHCQQPRFDSAGKPQQRFRYLPLEPRIKSLFLSPSTSNQMKYRANFKHTVHEISDVFDGSHYQDLLMEQVVIDGVEYEDAFFSECRDVALGFLMDGFQIFKRRRRGSATCWPLIAINFNLPPEIRTHLVNIIPLGIIPGPRAPTDFDSFLRPFIDECKLLAKGVRAFDLADNTSFTLHVYPISCHGDMPAIKHLMHFKGPNGMRPCRGCEICGVHDSSKPRTPYYVPLNPPSSDPNALGWDPGALPLRTDVRIQAQIQAVGSAPSLTLQRELRQTFGINGKAAIAEIPSIKLDRSFPHEWMHLWLENLVKNLVALWQGNYKALVNERCRIDDRTWEIIGRETAAASRTIPSQFG